MNEFIERDHEELNVINRYYQNFLDSVRATGSVIITDPKINKLIFDDELLSHEIYNILLETKNLLASSPYIEFINFYIPEKNYYYSTYTGQREPGNLLNSNDWIYPSPRGNSNFNPIPMNIKLDTVNDLYTIYSNMLVFILPLSLQMNSPYLVIFVDADKFRKNYRNETQSDIVILNNNDDVICHTGVLDFGIKRSELLIAQELDQAVLKGSHIYGNLFKKDLNIISTVTEENYTIIKKSSIMPFVKTVRNVILNSFLLIFIIIVAVYFVSSKIFKKLYSPIQSLLSKLHEVDRFKDEEKTDLEIINFLNIEAESVSQVDSLKNFRDQNMVLVRNRYLDQFLTGKITLKSPDAILQFEQRLDIPFARGDYFKIITCSYKKNIESYYTNLLRRGFIQQYFNRQYPAICYIDTNNDFITIISSPERFDESVIYTFCNEFIEFLESEDRQIFEQLQFLSISDQCRGFMNLPRGYDLIQNMNSSYYKYAHQRIITSEFIERDSILKAEYPLNLEENILKAIRNHNCEDSIEFLGQFFIVLAEFDHISIFNFTLRFISSLISTLQIIERKSRINFEIQFNSWFKSVIKAETMDIAHGDIKTLIRAVDDKYSQLIKSKTENYGRIIKNFIDDHYNDPNLCINLIADNINLSPAYCGQIFRKTYSDSINDYVISLRLEKAKDIIDLEPNRKINDISIEVGIPNYRYFYTKFKLAYGVTPGHYRISKTRNSG